MAVLYEIAGWADILLWIVFAVQVAYLLFFAWKGGMLRPWNAVRQPVRNKRRFAVFFPKPVRSGTLPCYSPPTRKTV